MARTTVQIIPTTVEHTALGGAELSIRLPFATWRTVARVMFCSESIHLAFIQYVPPFGKGLIVNCQYHALLNMIATSGNFSDLSDEAGAKNDHF